MHFLTNRIGTGDPPRSTYRHRVFYVGTDGRELGWYVFSDGYLIVRHPDLGACLEMADRVGTHLRLVAG